MRSESIHARDVIEASADQISNFQVTSNAHRLRVSATVQQLLQDEIFLTRNPEYRLLAQDLEGAVKTTLNHDYKKTNLRPDHPVVQTLARDYGTDFRSLKLDDPLRLNLSSQVDMLNQLDDQHWASSTQKYIKNPYARQLLTDLVTTVDYYDVHQARKSEFGAGSNGSIKRSFLSVSDWIDPKSGFLKFSSQQLTRMRSIAGYLETDFDYGPILKKYDPRRVEKHGFGSMAKELRAESKSLKPIRSPTPPIQTPHPTATISETIPQKPVHNISSATGAALEADQLRKFARKIPAFGLLVMGADYGLNPEEFNSERVAIALTGTSEDISDCQSPNCNEFRDLCKKLNKGEAVCAQEEFFNKLSLQQQSEKRMDHDLDKIMQRYSPKIVDIRCEKNAYNIETADSQRELVKHVVEFDPQGHIQRVTFKAATQASSKSTLLLFSQEQPDLLQYALSSNARNQGQAPAVYRTLKFEDLVDKKIYPHQTLFSPDESVAIKHGKNVARLIVSNKSQVSQCCNDRKCIDYFTQRQTQRRKAPTQIRPSNLGAH